MRKNSQLPPISPSPAGGMKESQKRDYSKPKSYKMVNQQNNNSYDANGAYNNDASLMFQQRNAMPRGNTPQRRNIQKLMGKNDDQISEIDMNSDTRSMQSA